MPRCITKQLRQLPPQDAEVHYSLFVLGWSVPGCQPDLQAAAVSPLLQAQVCTKLLLRCLSQLTEFGLQAW